MKSGGQPGCIWRKKFADLKFELGAILRPAFRGDQRHLCLLHASRCPVAILGAIVDDQNSKERRSVGEQRMRTHETARQTKFFTPGVIVLYLLH
jgi:hypothetical protein